METQMYNSNSSSLTLSSYSFIPRNSISSSSPKFPAHEGHFLSPQTKRSLVISSSSSILKISQFAKSSVVRQEKVFIQNKHGETLVGLLRDTGSSEIVILCHGFRSSKEHPPIANFVYCGFDGVLEEPTELAAEERIGGLVNCSDSRRRF